MGIEIDGPKRPPKAFVDLEVNPNRAWYYEGLFDKPFIESIRLFFDPSKGYFGHGNKIVYDTIWQKIFQSLTGESLPDCVTQTLLSDENYIPYIEKTLGSVDRYIEAIGHHPMDVHGVNLDGTWIISRDKKNLALLVDEFHEIGHRVYPNSADRYNHELGANYFMILALQKTNTELNLYGASIPEVDFGEQITGDHSKSLQEAKRLLTSKTKYVHKVE